MATVQRLECGRTWGVSRRERALIEPIAEDHTEATAHIEFRVTGKIAFAEAPAGELKTSGRV